jgi:N-acetylmuramoyl-L-alanine amidase
MKKTSIIFLLFITAVSLYPQRLYKISVTTKDTRETLSYISRNGTDFVSSKEIAKILWAGFYYNSSAGKIEIKFSDYSMKFTAGNQFVVIWRKSDLRQTVVQLPSETFSLNNDLFIPLVCCIDYISLCYGKQLLYDEAMKNLKVTDDAVNRADFLPELKRTDPKPKVQSRPGIKYDIYAAAVEEKSNGTLIRLKTRGKIPVPKHSINKETLFVFLSGISVDPAIADSFTPAGLVKEIRLNIISENNVQLEFGLSDGYSTSEALIDPESSDILITIRNNLFIPGSRNYENMKSKWVFDAVVIDAGHGGKDPGAIGVTGVREKDVNLGIALKLGKLIEHELPDVKVIYTRKSDEFIELYMRGKIANENNGKLFISVHCNSTEQKDIANRGFEVYLLRPGRTKQSIQIAEFENSVIKYEDNPDRYQKLTDENFILVSMAHSQFMRYSEKFSDFLTQNWKKEMPVPSLGIKQAGFYVLVGASMPGVLIESGFLSNRKDEAFLASQTGQKEIAQTILKTVRQYKDYYSRDVQN